MSFDDAISAMANDALKFIKDGQVLGLGSGRAASVFVKALSSYITKKRIAIVGIPTSLQIKMIAEGHIQLMEADQVSHIDIVFDGADQIDAKKNLIKGGGGALFRENLLISMAKKVVIMADSSKFSTHLNIPVPIEVHPLARRSVEVSVKRLGGISKIRLLDRGFPFMSENGNIILDCDFGVITNPSLLARQVTKLAGVIQVGIFDQKPHVIYKAKANGQFSILE